MSVLRVKINRKWSAAGGITSICLILWAVGIAGCGKSETGTLPVRAEISAPHQDLKISTGESVFFQGKATGGLAPYQFRWRFGIVAPDSAAPTPGVVKFDYEGVYRVELTVKDGSNANDTAVVNIVVEQGQLGQSASSIF